MALAGLLLLGLSACSPATTSGTHGAGSTTGASTATATPDLSVDHAAVVACGFQQQPAGTLTQAGDLLITAPILALGYPSIQLAVNMPMAPYKVEQQVSNNVFNSAGDLGGSPRVNPNGNGAPPSADFQVQVCNTSASQSHTLAQAVVQINTFTPWTDPLTVWQGCDMAYSRQNPNVGEGGCGGGFGGDETLQASFPASAGAGQSVMTTQVSNGQSEGNANSYGPLPVSLKPDKPIAMLIQVKAPTTPGTYVFSVGIVADGAAPVYTPRTDPILFAPVAHTFTGAACKASAMQAQIPANDMTSYYICPQQ